MTVISLQFQKHETIYLLSHLEDVWTVKLNELESLDKELTSSKSSTLYPNVVIRQPRSEGLSATYNGGIFKGD
jgi:hypothetical protein